jgi:hypothetical protein
MWGRGIEEVGGQRDSLKICVGYGELSVESDERNEKRYICDFNRRWLKDSSLLCCIIIVLTVGRKVRYLM